jgi:hypothetical protein
MEAELRGYLPLFRRVNALYVRFEQKAIIANNPKRRLWVMLGGDYFDVFVPDNEDELAAFQKVLDETIANPERRSSHAYFVRGDDGPESATGRFLAVEAAVSVVLTDLVNCLTASSAIPSDFKCVEMCDKNLRQYIDCNEKDSGARAVELEELGGTRYLLMTAVGCGPEAIAEADLLRPEWVRRWCRMGGSIK